MKLPELLAPAGGMEALKAAVENGANAVYLGGSSFNARASAANFSREELKEAVEYAHLRGVKVYTTVNILIDNGEIPELVDYVHHLYSIGVDAVILQDLGVARLLRSILPEMPCHASTQMTLVNSPGVKFLQDLGFERVVLARETAVKDMELIYRATGAELEVFVHGALCICYSGQCLMSSMIGGRSGNRGRCAQPCRLTYDLVDLTTNTRQRAEVGEHLLSPKDLNLVDYLKELAEAGVSSLKVEGRMKRSEYVATVIRNYRRVLDRIDREAGKGTEEEHRELAQIFNREFTTGYLLDNPGFELMSYKRPNNRGVMLGRVQQYNREKGQALIKLETELNLGDGIEAWTKKGREGVYVNHIWDNGKELASAGQGMSVWIELPGPVSLGDRIFKTHDEKLVSKARLSYQEGKGERRIPLDFAVEGELGQPLRITVRDADGNIGVGITDINLEAALKRPLSEDYLRQQLDRLGNTPFSLGRLTVNLSGSLIVPVREINEARRKAVEEVMTGRLGQRLVVTRAEVDRRLQGLKSKAKSTQKQKSKLAVSVGDIISLEKAVSAGADIIYLGGDQFRSKPPMGREQLARGIELCLKRDITPVVQLPRLVHEQQVNNLAGYIEYIDSAGGRAVQVPDIGALALALEHGNLAVYADYGLNVFNDYTLKALDEFGVRVSTLSPELNLAQIKSLTQIRSQACEFLVYGALPLMITEHCTVGSLLGGGNRKGCSRPCTTSKYGLKDRMSFTFPVETDQNCRMYIFNAKELNLLENLGDITAAGAHSLRLELKKDSAEYVAKVTKVFRRELDRAWGTPQYRPLDESMELLKELRPGGYTKGHYFRGVLQ